MIGVTVINKRNYIPGKNEAIIQEPAGTVTVNTNQYFVLDEYFKFDISDVIIYAGASKTLVDPIDYDLIVDQKYTDSEIGFSDKTLYSMIKFTNAVYDGEPFFVSGLNFGTMVDNEAVWAFIMNLLNPAYVDFDPQSSAPPFLVAREWFDEFAQTMKVYNDKGIDMQMCRTISSRFTAEEDILKGETLYASQLVGPLVYGVKKASSATYNENWVVGMAANDALTGEVCEFMQQGFITQIDTTGYEESTPLYFSPTRGALSNSRPGYPSEPIIMGASLYSHVTEGVLGVNMGRDQYDYEFGATVLERPEIIITSDGVTIYAEVYNLEDPLRDLPVQMSGEIRAVNTTSGGGTVQPGAARVQLLPGAVDSAQEQMIYADFTGETAVVKTIAAGAFPPPPYARIGDVSVLDAARTQADAPLMHRRSSNCKADQGTGAISRIFERLSQIPPEYSSGVIPTATTDGTDMQLSVIAGKVWQTRLQDFPALSVDTSGIYVANGPGGAGLAKYSKYTSLSDLMGYTSANEARDTSSTGNLFIFACVNKATGECKLFANLPRSLGATSTGEGLSIYKDENRTTITSAPQELRQTAFAVCRIPFRLNGGNYQFLDSSGNATNSGAFIDVMLGELMGGGAGAGSGGDVAIQSLLQTLVVGNDAGGVQIKNMADGIDPQDAVTFTQLDSQSSQGALGNLNRANGSGGFEATGLSLYKNVTTRAIVSEAELDLVSGESTSIRFGEWNNTQQQPVFSAVARYYGGLFYADNSVITNGSNENTCLTKGYVDDTFLKISNLNLQQVLAADNDAGAQQIKNMADGIDPQDAVSLSQLVAINLQQVLAADNDAGAQQIKNMADGIDPQDAVSLSQLVAKNSEGQSGIVQLSDGNGDFKGAIASATEFITMADSGGNLMEIKAHSSTLELTADFGIRINTDSILSGTGKDVEFFWGNTPAMSLVNTVTHSYLNIERGDQLTYVPQPKEVLTKEYSDSIYLTIDDGVVSGLSTSDDIATVLSDGKNLSSVEATLDLMQSNKSYTNSTLTTGWAEISAGSTLRYRIEGNGDLTIQGYVTYSAGALGNFFTIGTGFPSGTWGGGLCSVKQGSTYSTVYALISSNVFQVLDSSLLGQTTVESVSIAAVFPVIK